MAVTGSGKGIQIVVGTDYNDRDLKRAQRDLDRLRGQAAKTAGPMQKLGNSIRSNLGPALAMAGAAAGAFAIKLGVDGVKAAIADQKTVEVLAATLENLGEAHRQAGVEEFVAGLESATGVADEELRPALGLLAVATGDVDEAQRRLKQAMDVSIGTGQNLTTVVKAFQRSLATGTAGSLSRYGIIVDENIVKTEGFGAALDEAAGAFSGLADREARTLEGRMRILSVEIDNVKEAFGYGFLNGLGDVGQEMDSVTDSVRELKPMMAGLGEQIGTLAKFLGDLEKNTGLVSAAFKGLTDITGPTLDAIIYFYRVLGQGEDPIDAFKAQLFGISDGTDEAAKGTGAYWSTVLKATGVTKDFIPPTQELIDELEAEADAAEKAAQEFDKLSGAISRTGAVTSYQATIDDLRKTLKETKGETSLFNDKGRETVGAYVDLAKNAGAYIETLDSQSQQASAVRDTLTTLEDQLGKTKMDPATQAALLGPFQALIDDLRESGLDVTELQLKLDKIKSKTITVRVNTETYGRPPGVSDKEWYGAAGGMVPKYFAGGGVSRGMDTVPAMLAPGEFIIRRQAVKAFGSDLFSQLNRGINPLAGMAPASGGRGGGFTINGGITVNTVAGERAETSLPRALRRMAFLAGVNG
jgi:hypothetical protein